MKIVMLCDFYNESLTYQENLLAKFYVKHGHDVVIITSTFQSAFDFSADRYNPAWPEQTYKSAGATIIKLPYTINFLNRVRKFRNLSEILEREAPDLLYIHDIMLNLPDAVRYIQHHPHARMILDYHADYANSGKNWLSRKLLHGVIRKRVLDQARPYLARIFPIVPGGAKFLREVYGVHHSEMELLPLGADLDLSREAQSMQAGRQLRRQEGISQDATVIFTGGKLTPAKRTEILIEAFLKLNRPNTYLFIAGDSAESDMSYKQLLLQAANNCSFIRFTGWLDTQPLLAHLDMADFAVFPASQSILWQQAIGMGKPLIIGESTAFFNGKQDISYLNLYENIILVDALKGGASALISHIQHLVDNPDARAKMSLGAHRVASEMLDWNKAIAKTLRFCPQFDQLNSRGS